jgi:hypothetical protein
VVSFNAGREENPARLDAFRAHYGIDSNVTIVGLWTGQLSDSGEEVRLLRPDTPPVEDPLLIPRVIEDTVLYDDLAPWPVAADGQGSSLVRGVPTSFAGDVASWTAAAATPGSVDFSGNVVGDLTGDGQVTAVDIDVLFDAVRRGSNVTSYDLNDDLAVNSGDVAHFLKTILATNFGDANLDGIVNSVDLNQVGIHWQQQACHGWADADFTGDGAVTSVDLNQLGINWLRTAPPVAAQAAAAADRFDRIPRAPLARPTQQVDPTLVDFVVAHSSSFVPATAGGVEHQPQINRLRPSQEIDPPLRFKQVKVSFESVRRRANSTATGQHRTQTIDDIFATLAVKLTGRRNYIS